MNRSMLLAATLAVALSAPAVSAWNSYGSYEPNTALDDPTLMWHDAPPATGLRIYFNAFTIMGTPVGGSMDSGIYLPYTVANPNVAALQTRNEVVGTEIHHAILGVWRDCNGDGYIGLGEQGVSEYDARLLLDTSVCPPVSGTPNTWPSMAFNYRGWVSELIPIGNVMANASTDKRLVADPEAMVWGDPGKPTDPASVAGGGSCNLFPARGQPRSTLGLIDYADCLTGVADEWNDQMDPLGDPLGLRFEDTENPATQTDHPLYVTTFGDDSADHGAVVLDDCSQPYLVNTGNVPAGGDGEPGAGVVPDLDDREYVRQPPAQPVNMNPTAWTVPGTFNTTFEDDCDYTNDGGQDFYGTIEGENVGNDAVFKSGAAWNFNFTQVDRGTIPPITLIGPGRAGMPDQYGVGYPGHYVADSYLLKETPATTRGSIPGGTFDIAAAPYYTFYAFVGTRTAATGALTPGGREFYGAPQCGGATTGVVNNWECDQSKWYRLPNGDPKTELYPFARPGQAYQLRDVDCADGSVLDGAIGVMPAYYGTAPCA